MAMDLKTLDRVGKFLKDATPEQLIELAEDMVQNAPHLMPIQLTPQERANAFIKMHLASISDKATASYVQGLIDCAYVTGLIDDDVSNQYQADVLQATKGAE